MLNVERLYEDRNWWSEFLYLIKNLWFVVIIAAAGLAVSVLLVSIMPKTYRAEAMYYLNKSELNSAYFTINEYQYYNLLLLDIEKMLQSKKLYSQIISQNAGESFDVTYEDYQQNLYVRIDATSTFFNVGFDSQDTETAVGISTGIEKIMEAQSAEIVRITSIELVDRTTLDKNPIAPNVKILVILGGLAGAFIGFCVVILRYALGRHVHTYVHAESLSGLRILSRIKYRRLSHLSIDQVIGSSDSSDYTVAKQLLLYGKERNNQKFFTVLSSDQTGKSDLFAFLLARHLAGVEEKTIFVPINPPDEFRMLLGDRYAGKGKLITDTSASPHYYEIIEEATELFDILIGTNRQLSITHKTRSELLVLFSELEKVYDCIVISMDAEEKLIFPLEKLGVFILSATGKSKKRQLKSNAECLKGINARVIGMAYLE